jgi:hypothetical protein
MRQKWRMMAQTCDGAWSIELRSKLRYRWRIGLNSAEDSKMIAFMGVCSDVRIENLVDLPYVVWRSLDENKVQHSPGVPIGVDRGDQSPAPLEAVEAAPACRLAAAASPS